MQPTFFSLNVKTLSNCQTKIMLKGFKFTPKPEISNIQLMCDLKTFAHKLRLIEYLKDHSVN